jgi:hypothetical protein
MHYANELTYDSSALVEEYREIMNVTSLTNADRHKNNTTKIKIIYISVSKK